jgi:hypothetical protein
VPPSKISSLSSGEFVGMTADDPQCRIRLKTFHSEIANDHEALRKEQESYKEIPPVRKLDNAMIHHIRRDVQDIICSEMQRLLQDPTLSYLIVKK